MEQREREKDRKTRERQRKRESERKKERNKEKRREKERGAGFLAMGCVCFVRLKVFDYKRFCGWVQLQSLQCYTL